MGKPKSVKIAQSQGIRRKRSVGAYGSKRGTPNKQVHRAQVREDDPRYREAMAEARAAEKALEKQIAAAQANPDLVAGQTPGAQWAKAQREREEAARAAAAAAEAAKEEAIRSGVRFEPWEGEPKPGWTIGQARAMVRQGYRVPRVMAQTGVGFKWLNDFPLDTEGRILEGHQQPAG